MGASSKDKGNAWELEVAKFLEEHFEGKFSRVPRSVLCLVEKMRKTQMVNDKMWWKYLQGYNHTKRFSFTMKQNIMKILNFPICCTEKTNC